MNRLFSAAVRTITSLIGTRSDLAGEIRDIIPDDAKEQGEGNQREDDDVPEVVEGHSESISGLENGDLAGSKGSHQNEYAFEDERDDWNKGESVEVNVDFTDLEVAEDENVILIELLDDTEEMSNIVDGKDEDEDENERDELGDEANGSREYELEDPVVDLGHGGLEANIQDSQVSCQMETVEEEVNLVGGGSKDTFFEEEEDTAFVDEQVQVGAEEEVCEEISDSEEEEQGGNEETGKGSQENESANAQENENFSETSWLGNTSSKIMEELPVPLTKNVEDRELEAVHLPFRHTSGLVWLVKFKDKERLELVPGDLMTSYFPQTVIKVYERHLQLGDASLPNAPSAGGKKRKHSEI